MQTYKEQIAEAMTAIDGLEPATWDEDHFAEADWPTPPGTARVWVDEEVIDGAVKKVRFGVGVWFVRPNVNEETRPKEPLPMLPFEQSLDHAMEELRNLLLRAPTVDRPTE